MSAEARRFLVAFTLFGGCTLLGVLGRRGCAESLYAQSEARILQLRAAEGPQRTRIVFRLIRTLGSLDGVHDAFGEIWSVALDSRANIYVVDRSRAQVLVFDSAGNFRAAIGRKGRGPGEFVSPINLAIGPGDSVLVFDQGVRRMSLFDPAGRFARSGPVLGFPLVNSIVFRWPAGWVIAAYSPTLTGVVHLLDSELAVVRSLGNSAPVTVPYYWESVLGGYLDVTPSGSILYSQKSPFELRLYGGDGTVLWVCRGFGSETTPPGEVVVVEGDRRRLIWDRYVHSAGVFAISDSLFLNLITDPVRDLRQLDLIDFDCRLRARAVVEGPVFFSSSRNIGNRRIFVGSRTLDFPEVVVYEMQLLH
ncbi:MAG: hypothetical protein KatS3mg081_0324 [Gemmatimonadales bacterium]|nr:MAG: hypothetical protein KatS3mg081_0324 [Gemmatimonadales bacterium]